MKKVLSLLLLFAACQKSNHSSSPQPKNAWSIYYYASGTGAVIVSNQLYHVDSTTGIAECLYSNVGIDTLLDNPYSARTYLFEFSQTAADGVIFTIPGKQWPNFKLPIDSEITFNLTPAIYGPLLAEYEIQLSGDNDVAQPDSVILTITFSRISGGTMDGAFSANFYNGFPLQNATITNGSFKNVPMKFGS